MKRFLVAAMFLIGFSVASIAATPVYDGNLINGVVTSSTSITINNSTMSGDYMSFQANFSTPTLIPSIFIDGVKSTGTITLTTGTGVHGSTLTIMGNSYVEGIDWTYNATYSSMSAYALFKVLSSTYGVRASGYVQFYSTYSVAGSTFTMYGKKFVGGQDYAIAYSTWNGTWATTATVANLYSVLSNNFNQSVLCQLNTSSITFTYYALGDAGNNTLAVTITTMAVSGMSGGVIAPLSGIVFDSTSVNALSLIRATATVVGASGNYTFTSSVSTSIIVTGMAGGVASQIQYAPFYTVYSTQTYPAGLSVLFTNSGGTSPTNLTANTTYFVIPFNSTSYRLATTRDNAIAGVSIAIGNSNLDRGTFVLTPVGLTDVVHPFGMVLQGSNDGKNWWNLSQSTVTVFSTSTWTTQYWDIGHYDYEYIQFVITPAANTLGSAFLQIIGYITKIAQ